MTKQLSTHMPNEAQLRLFSSATKCYLHNFKKPQHTAHLVSTDWFSYFRCVLSNSSFCPFPKLSSSSVANICGGAFTLC